MKKMNLLFASLLLALSFTSEAKSPPGAADVPANILIMLDTSGSMNTVVNANSKIRYPIDVAVDSNGNIFVLEHSNHRITKYNSSGGFIQRIGKHGRGKEQFQYPYKIAIDANDNIYVADTYNHRIQKLDNDGKHLLNFSISYPRSLTIDSNGNVYGGGGSTIRKWRSSGGSYIDSWYSYSVRGLSAYNGSIYAANYGGSVISKTSESGKSQDSWPTHNSVNPYDIEVNSNGIYIADVNGSYVQKYSLAGVYSNQWGGYGTDDDQFRYVYGIGSDSSGNIYVADILNHAVKKFDSGGSYTSTPAGGDSDSRFTQAKKVIKKLVSDSDINKGANFGLIEWATYAPKVNIPISSSGAARIYNEIDDIKAGSGAAGYLTYVDRAMKTAQGYLNSMGNKPSCQKTYVLLISDGYWNEHNSAKNIVTSLKNQGIKTFVIGFHLDTTTTQGQLAKVNYEEMAEAGGTSDSSPIFTDNWQYLYTTLSNYIRQAISSRFTASAPVIMPDIKSGDFLFQSTFEYIKDHQWEGELTKYKINADGSIGDSVWEAGKKLDAKSESSRQIWTIANHIGIDTSLNNFSTSNLSELKNLIWYNSGKSPTDAEGTDLINFVRGLDAYDEDSDGNTTEKRWKLGDIYHSKPTVVGSPSAQTTSNKDKSNTENYYRYQQGYDSFKNGNNRKEVVYVGANDGMLHAFDSNTGDELWAFIPPTML
ncbi:MAG: VWA domain-containing protein, partial [Candidatus Thioglobus sp.]